MVRRARPADARAIAEVHVKVVRDPMLWVLADNPRARRFYEREGWRPEGTRIDTVRGTDVEETLYRLAFVGG
jgi:hypothetical protein